MKLAILAGNAKYSPRGPYWLTRELGVDIFPVQETEKGLVIVEAEDEDKYWEYAKRLNVPELFGGEIIRDVELHELSFRIGQMNGKEIIPNYCIVKVFDI